MPHSVQSIEELPLSAASSVPITEAQEGLWYAQRLDAANPIFNVAHALHFDGPLDLAAFTQAVNGMVAEADSLALRIAEVDGEPRQWIEESQRPWLEVRDLSAEVDPEAAARVCQQSLLQQPVDPASEPLASNLLLRLSAERHLWVLRVHHLAIDGVGMDLLAKRVAALYRAALQQKPPAASLAPLALAWQVDRDYRQSDKRQKDAAYWQAAFADAPEVVGMAAGRAQSQHYCHRQETHLPDSVARALWQFSQQHQLSWPDLLTCLLALYSQRLTARDDTIVGVPFMGRFGSPAAAVPAMLMNVLPLALTLDESRPLSELALETARQLSRGRRRGRYRSEQLRRDLGLLGGERRLFGALVNVLPFESAPEFAGLTASLEVLATGPVDDITFTFRGDLSRLDQTDASPLTLEIEANPARYDSDTVAAHLKRLRHFIGEALAVDSLAQLTTSTPEESDWQLYHCNDNDQPLPDTSLTALLEQALTTHADACALRIAGQSLSYAELDARSAALATQLRDKGIGRDDLVAVMLPRSVELMVALLGILRAGAGYLPLDAAHPPARLHRLLQRSQARCLLADADAAQAIAAELLCLPPSEWWQSASGRWQGGMEVAADDAAYVIFTSGSTGEPKGVLIEHRAIVNRLLWMQSHYGIDSSDRILQKTPITFDVSVWELFLPLISGACLVLALPDEHRDPRALAQRIASEQITTLHFVPSMLEAFLAEPAAAGLRIKRVFCSGEALSAELRDRFHQLLDAELHNLYGPTEAAVDVSYWPASRDDVSQPLPIGFPVWNTRLYVLDSQLRPLPNGVAGHLYLGGVQLARGYLGQPELTAERFIDNPIVAGERLYQSGDLAYRRDDGAIVYLGRSDSQVKIRGLRIELGEVEAAVTACDGVSHCRVLARRDEGVERLVAYLVPETHYSEEALRRQLAAQLPDYMLPSAMVTLAELPLTSNGKLDRRALPAPDFVSQGGRVPQTASEQQLSQLFAEVLGLSSPPDAQGDFFRLGGDSLLAVQLVRRIEESFGVDPGLGSLFSHPSIEALAARLDSDEWDADNGLAALLPLAEGDETAAPLFCVHPAGGISWCYRQLAQSLAPERSVYGLQAAALSADKPLPSSIEALAADYVALIRAQQPQGPYHLLGWSLGGIIAQAMAVELRRQGCELGALVALDAYPSDCWRAEPDPGEGGALRALLAIAGFDPEQYPGLITRTAIVSFLRESGSALGRLPDEILDGVVRVVTDTNRLVREHHHQHVDTELLHIRASHDHQDGKLRPDHWQDYVAAIKVVDLPFHHGELVSEAATRQLLPSLLKQLDVTERS